MHGYSYQFSGMQNRASVLQDLLELCGRSHTLYDVYKAIEDVHTASPPSWSLDLISGLPHLIEEKWRDSLSKAVDSEPPHISVYDLQLSKIANLCSDLLVHRLDRHSVRPCQSGIKSSVKTGLQLIFFCMYSLQTQALRKI